MIEFFGRQNDVLYFDNAASTLALKSVVDKSMEFFEYLWLNTQRCRI